MARRAHLAVLICLASLIIASPIWPLMAVAHATDISHPRAYVFGTVTKEVMFGQPWQRWEDEQGVDHLLPFTAQSGQNYTIDAWFVNFSTQFANESFKFSGSASDSWAKYIDSYGMRYYAIKNVLDDQTQNYEIATLDTLVEIPVSTNTHVLICLKYVSTTYEGHGSVYVRLKLLSAGNVYYLNIGCVDKQARGTVMTSWSSPRAWVEYGVDPGDTVLCCYNIERLFNDITGLNIDVDSVSEIELQVYTYNDTASTDETVEAYFRFCFFTDSPVYIASKDYGLLNTTLGTEIEIPTSVGDSLNIYGAKADRAYEVQIPFIYEVTPDMTSYADELKIAYTWQFELPDDTRAGTFSGTGINFTLNKDPGYYDYLYLNGEDKLSAIADATAGDTVTLATGLTTGTLYTLQTRVKYTAEEYDALTAAPVFWYNPGSWLMYHFWELIAAIASVLGLAGVVKKAKARGRAYRKPVWR